MDEEAPHCCFDDWAVNAAQRAKHRETVAPISTRLLRALVEAGLQGRTVLDVGCGAGDLALATLAHGATHVSGIDLGPGAVEAARALAGERGSGDRATFIVGDGSTAPLPRADVVVLNRVVCCYPDVDPLLENTLSVAGGVYAVTAPVDRGAVGLMLRVAGWLANLWYAARPKRYRGYRTFVHDVGAIDTQVRAVGFTPIVRERSRVVWDLAVYAR